MMDVLYMAWRYLAHHRYKTTILVLSITLIVYVPVGLRVLVQQSERELTARAGATPLLVGSKGSAVDLVLSGLYFSGGPPSVMPFGEVGLIMETGLALPVPLHVRFHAQGDPIVGTTLDYFELRGLTVAAGRQMTRLGDCVVGAGVARRRGLSPGDPVISSPENVFDLAGVYPLKMRVAGILHPTGGPDDDAVFADVRTAWIIEGLGHGHQDLASNETGVLRRNGDRIVANAAVVQYNEITVENSGSFHFHGVDDQFPINAVIAVPPDRKALAILMGRYETEDGTLQAIRPATVVDELLETVFTVQSYVVAAVVAVGGATMATTALVFLLSIRVRRREIETMIKIGGSRTRIALVLGAEIAGVFVIGIGLAAGLTALTGQFGAELVRRIFLS